MAQFFFIGALLLLKGGGYTLDPERGLDFFGVLIC